MRPAMISAFMHNKTELSEPWNDQVIWEAVSLLHPHHHLAPQVWPSKSEINQTHMMPQGIKRGTRRWHSRQIQLSQFHFQLTIHWQCRCWGASLTLSMTSLPWSGFQYALRRPALKINLDFYFNPCTRLIPLAPAKTGKEPAAVLSKPH